MRQPSNRFARSVMFPLFVFALCSSKTTYAQLVDNPMDVGAPKLPQYVVDECGRKEVYSNLDAQTECLARMGFPATRKPLPKTTGAACAMAGDIPGWKWKERQTTVQDRQIKVWYRTTFVLKPEDPSDSRSDYLVDAFAEIDLGSLQANLPALIRQNMPPNECSADTVVTGQSEGIVDGVYTHQTNFRTDISVCTRGPCVPNVWDECTTRTDVGQVSSVFNMRISAQLNGDTLLMHTDNSLQPGEKPNGVRLLQGLERLWNGLTGNLTRAGAARRYDEILDKAVADAILTSGNLASQQLVVPGMGAYKISIDSATLRLVPNAGKQRLLLSVKSSADIPNAAVCAVRKQLEEHNDFHTTR